GVADDVVGDARQLHHDHAHVFNTFWQLRADQLLHRHVPAHVVDGRRTVVEPVGDGRDLVIRSSFGQLFERAMDVPNGGHGVADHFAVHGEDVLENAVGVGVRGSQV